MNLFIDTNILLSFYHFTKDDLEELEKLIVLIKERKVTLYVPQQVIDEFYRNRESKINQALKEYREIKPANSFPQIFRNSEGFGDLHDLHKKYLAKHAELLKKVEEQVWKESLKADEVVQRLFNKAKKLLLTPELMEKARLRYDIGNPPGKKGSLGDAINWETLLNHIPQGENLYFVADDGDFFSPLHKEASNFFLRREWSREKSSDLEVYRSMGGFFKENYPNIGLAVELEKDLCIQKLAASSSFSETHSVIHRLKHLGDFTRSQVNDIMEAGISNTQVSWIIEDANIHNFFESIVQRHKVDIEEDALNEIQALLYPEPPEWFFEEDR